MPSSGNGSDRWFYIALIAVVLMSTVLAGWALADEALRSACEPSGGNIFSLECAP